MLAPGRRVPVLARTDAAGGEKNTLLARLRGDALSPFMVLYSKSDPWDALCAVGLADGGVSARAGGSAGTTLTPRTTIRLEAIQATIHLTGG